MNPTHTGTFELVMTKERREFPVRIDEHGTISVLMDGVEVMPIGNLVFEWMLISLVKDEDSA
jgi:hypothetical protein